MSTWINGSVCVVVAVALVTACGAPSTMALDEAAVEGPRAGGASPFAPAAASPETCGNGLDDDNNGSVDDGCPCTEGATQRCFAGLKALAGIGACTMGTQTCVSAGGNEVSVRKWGPCVGGGAASAETCNGVDDDCNGRPDDAPQCTPGGGDGGVGPGNPGGNPPGNPPGTPAGPPCQGTGLIFASLGDKCIDDGGGSAKDDDLQVYCVNNIARFCLSYEACPWRDGITTPDSVTCSRAGLSSTYFVSARQSCGVWEGHNRICCSMTGQVSFTGC